MADKHRQAVELLAELRKTKENIERKSGKVKPDVLYSLLQVRCLTIMQQLQLLYSEIYESLITRSLLKRRLTPKKI